MGEAGSGPRRRDAELLRRGEHGDTGNADRVDERRAHGSCRPAQSGQAGHVRGRGEPSGAERRRVGPFSSAREPIRASALASRLRRVAHGLPAWLGCAVSAAARRRHRRRPAPRSCRQRPLSTHRPNRAARSTSRCERPATGSPCTAERYYRELHDTGYVEQIVVEVADGKLVHGRSGSGASGFDQPFELLDDAAGGLSSVEQYLLRRNTAESVRDYEAKHGIGTLPNGLKRWADSQIEPKVDRRRTLTSALRRALHQRAGMADYSWRRPPRRQRPGSPLQFPGMVQPVPSLAVVMERIAARRSSSRWQYTQTRRSACVGRCSGALKRSTQIGARSWRLPWQAIEARDTGCSSGSRLQVADNPSTPSEVMHRLVRDDTVLVRHAACASLRLRRRHLFGT